MNLYRRIDQSVISASSSAFRSRVYVASVVSIGSSFAAMIWSPPCHNCTVSVGTVVENLADSERDSEIRALPLRDSETDGLSDPD